MYGLLSGMRVVEASSFVAAPTAGLYLAQMGADVIRIDQLGGGPDFHRWPRAPGGASLYWEGLNKGKRSVALDLSQPEGRELMRAIVTAPGDDSGLFLTNFPVDGFLAHAALAQRRPDLVTVRVMGRSDGGPALDYTVNCALGVPHMTGPARLGDEPVNHVLPAWDLLTGAYAAFALMTAHHHRVQTGQGQEVRIPLADVGIATLANLGQLAETMVGGTDRPRYGNDVYGAFGRDFVTSDGERLMIMAITSRQWRGLIDVLGIAHSVADVEHSRGISFATDEGVRFEHRDALFPMVAAAVAGRTAAELGVAFDRAGCCWGQYGSLSQAANDPMLVTDNPVFEPLAQPSGLTYPVPGAMATLPAEQRGAPRPAPVLGDHTADVLRHVVGLSEREIAQFAQHGVIAASAGEAT